MMDVTEVTAVPRTPALYMAAVFDAFSRVPLALQVFDSKPAATDMARLLRAAARAFEGPKYLITDLGGEFTGRAFRQDGPAPRRRPPLRLHATASRPPRASSDSGGRSRRPPGSTGSTCLSHRRTSRRGSSSRSSTTSASGLMRVSGARRRPRRSSASSPLTARPSKHHEAGRAKARSSHRSTSSISTPGAAASPSSGKSRSTEPRLPAKPRACRSGRRVRAGPAPARRRTPCLSLGRSAVSPSPAKT